jgi:hypothetical protein
VNLHHYSFAIITIIVQLKARGFMAGQGVVNYPSPVLAGPDGSGILKVARY